MEAMANAWDKFIYVYGGWGSGGFVDTMFRLDVTNMSSGWQQVNPQGDTRVVRVSGVSATLNGAFYYLAGGFGNSSFNPTISSYNPSTNTWIAVAAPSLPANVFTSRIRGCVVALGDSLYFMYGQYLFKWNPKQTNWINIPTSPPWQRFPDPSCVAYDDKVVQLVGTAAATYDPVNGVFAALPSTEQPILGRNHFWPVAQVCRTAVNRKGMIRFGEG